MDQEVLDARAKLAARFGATQIGGKGKKISFYHFNINVNYLKKFGYKKIY